MVTQQQGHSGVKPDSAVVVIRVTPDGKVEITVEPPPEKSEKRLIIAPA